MFTITAIAALQDNYIWAIHNQTEALVVDPGEAAPVMSFLAARDLRLTGIFCTHRHHDHIGGIEKLRTVYNAPVYGQRHEKNPHITHDVKDGEKIRLDAFGLTFDVIGVPGHLNDHVAYYSAPMLFSGDVLFGAGCGKNFEGSVEQLHQSLQKLAALPDDTEVYCAHEYTASNLRFAVVCEPGNADIQKRVIDTKKLRDQGLATIPSTMRLEKATNPFLRCQKNAILTALQNRGLTDTSASAAFAALRKWRDEF